GTRDHASDGSNRCDEMPRYQSRRISGGPSSDGCAYLVCDPPCSGSDDDTFRWASHGGYRAQYQLSKFSRKYSKPGKPLEFRTFRDEECGLWHLAFGHCVLSRVSGEWRGA